MSKPAIWLLLSLLSPIAMAAEGHWTLDDLPRGAWQQDFQFDPGPDWITRVQKATLRLSGGCTGALVSARGLVLTNQHCLRRCLAQLSGPDRDHLADGFLAKADTAAPICPEIQAHQLLSIDDISAAVARAAAPAQTRQRLANDCSDPDADIHCEAVSLHAGGGTHLYRYRAYRDIRMVFAPEQAIATFGGRNDRHKFPRYALDAGLLRIFVEDAPLRTNDFFPLHPAGLTDNELALVSGYPGQSQRHLTVAQLHSLIERVLPERIDYLGAMLAALQAYAAQGPEQAANSRRERVRIADARQAMVTQLEALQAPGFMGQRRDREAAVRAAIAADSALRRAYADAWQDLAAAEQRWQTLYRPYVMVERLRGYQSELLAMARLLIRAGEELAKPSEQRLPEFRADQLPVLTQRLFSAAPIDKDLDTHLLRWSLTRLREQLGADHPAVKATLGEQAPERLSGVLIEKTQLDQLAVRRALWDGGAEAIAASRDPLIRYAKLIEPHARQLRTTYANDVAAVRERSEPLIARARREVAALPAYPPANLSLRVSYGRHQGWQEAGQDSFAQSSIGGAFVRSQPKGPYRLPERWLQAETALSFEQPMNFLVSADILSGNSGSPVLNRAGQLVGLVFDGNLHAQASTYAYKADNQRAIAVHAAAIIEALRSVYAATALVQELTGRTADD